MKFNNELVTLFRLGASVLLGIFGFVLIFLWPIVLKSSVLVLGPNTFAYKYWKKLPFEIPTDIYFFNWTNPQDIYNSSIKPKFQEIGPYRFWQREEKTNITWNANGTVTYNQRKFWHYDDQDPKNGNLDDLLTTADPLTLTSAYVLRDWNYYIRKAIYFSLRGRFFGLSRTVSIREMLFDGYSEPLIKIGASMPFFRDRNIPRWTRAGWFYTRNGSTEWDGVFNMGTGDGTVFGQIYNWDHENKTKFYDGTCADVNGTAGTFYPINPDKTNITIFSADIRRSATLKFDKEETVSGVLGHTYMIEDYFLDNGTLFPENRCFCVGECMPSGMLNLSTTRWGAPVFGSLPHFHRADPYYLNAVEGLKPDPAHHEFTVTIEPNTGLPLKADAKFQLNLLLTPIEGVSLFENAPKIYFPMVWIRQHAQVQGFEAFVALMAANGSTIFSSVGALMVLASSILVSLIVYRKYDEYIQKTQRRMHFTMRNLEEQRRPLKEYLDE